MINDVAFVFMDLLDHGLPRLAWRLVSSYLELTGDYDGLAMLRFYAVYRALVRAKVALIRLRQPQLSHHVRLRQHTTFEHYLLLAERLREPGCPAVIAMGGPFRVRQVDGRPVFSRSLGGVRVRSDVERKRLFGLAPSAASLGDIYWANLQTDGPMPVSPSAHGQSLRRSCQWSSMRQRCAVMSVAPSGSSPRSSVSRARWCFVKRLSRYCAPALLHGQQRATMSRRPIWQSLIDSSGGSNRFDKDERIDMHVIATGRTPIEVEEDCVRLALALRQSTAS